MIYPTQIPIDAVQVVFETMFDPTTANTQKLVAAGYQILGYALGQTIGEPTPVGAGLIGATTSDEDKLARLQALYMQHQHRMMTGGMAQMNATWQTVMQYAMLLAMALLARQRNPVPGPFFPLPTPPAPTPSGS